MPYERPHASASGDAVQAPGNGTSRLTQTAGLRQRLLVAAVLAVLTLALFSAIASGVQREGYFGADDLYAPTLITDLLSWSGSLRDWRITPAPYIFPDLALYLPAHLASPNVETAQYLAALAHLLLFAWFAYRLVRAVVGPQDLAAACIALVVLPLLVLRIAEVIDVPGLGPLFRITNHGGGALGSAALLALCFDSSRAGLVRWSILASVSLLTGISDPLFAVSYGAPLLALGGMACVPGIWSAIIERADPLRAAIRNRSLITALLGLLGASLTSRVHGLLNELHSVVLSKTRENVWRGLLRDFTEGHPGKGAWMLAVVVLCLATLLRRPKPGSGKLRALALWQVGSFGVTLAAIIWTKNYLDAGALRYVTVPFALAPVTVATLLAHWVHGFSDRMLRQRVVGLGTGLMTVALFASAVIDIPLLVRGEYRSEWRAKAQCVSDVLQREQVDVVLTDYWRCKPLLLFSDRKVLALQMRSKLKRPYFWISSRAWYRGEHLFGVIATNELRPDAIVRQYGDPAQVERCEDVELFSYRGRAREKMQSQMSRMFRGFVADPNPP